MAGDQKVLDELFEKAAANHACFVSKIKTGALNNFVDDELSLTLTAFSKSLGTHLEILEFLRGEIKEVMKPN